MTTSPADRLLQMERDGSVWLDLLVEHQGSLALAAYDVAALRLKARGVWTHPVPTPRELWAAAQDVAAKVAWTGTIPTALALADECRREGRKVLP